MELEEIYFNQRKDKASQIYAAQKDLYCPYFRTRIVLNSDGFHHLQFSSRQERNKKEQLLKFSLLPLAFEIIRKSGTVQEYRRLLTPIAKPSGKDRSVPMKIVEYWGLVGIVGENPIKVKTVLRKIGDGNITFWSVMPCSNLRKGHQKLFTQGIEDA